MILFFWIVGVVFFKFLVVIIFYFFFGIDIIIFFLKKWGSGIWFIKGVFLIIWVGVFICVFECIIVVICWVSILDLDILCRCLIFMFLKYG